MESIHKAVSKVMNRQKDQKKDASSSSPPLTDSASATAKKCSTTLGEKKDAVAYEPDKDSEGASHAKGKCESKAAEVSDCASNTYSGEKSGEGSCGGSSRT